MKQHWDLADTADRLLLEEALGRAIAARFGLRFMGLLGCLIEAKRRASSLPSGRSWTIYATTYPGRLNCPFSLCLSHSLPAFRWGSPPSPQPNSG